MPRRPVKLLACVLLSALPAACNKPTEAKTDPADPPTTASTPGTPHAQGLPGFFDPRPGETWTYEVQRDLPPDSVLNDDDQLRSTQLTGGGFRLTFERVRVCTGTETPPELGQPLTVIEISDQGVSTGKEYIDLGPDGMVARAWKQAGSPRGTLPLLTPGVLLASPRMAPGQAWTVPAGDGAALFQFRVIERTKLIVPAGTYDTLRVQMNSGRDARTVRRTLWFAANTGIVKEESTYYDDRRIAVRETSVLTSWTQPAPPDAEPAPTPEEPSPPVLDPFAEPAAPEEAPGDSEPGEESPPEEEEEEATAPGESV